MIIPTIKTARLLLRPFVMEDAKLLYQILGQKGVLQYFPNTSPPTLEKVEIFISRQLEHWEKYGYGWWAVEPLEEKRLIGWNGLQYLPDTDETEIAYLLDKNYWGLGYATEGAKAGLGFGFNELGMEIIVGVVHPENTSSQHVLEKLGMPFIERTSYFGIEVFRYALGRSEFIARQV